MTTTTEIMRAEESDARTMVAAVRNRLAAVRELLKSELKGPTEQNPEGVDYGVIPGTKKKTLLQPGAEKIALMFSFTPSYTFTRQELPGGHLEVTALCTLTHSPTGRVVGQAEGSASTMESKHRYRGAGGKACPECGAMACIPSKKEYGGGYFCKQANGGCGKAFKANTDECKALDAMPATKQENPDPADQRNTVSKIAQKRAYVSAVKGASAASEVFTVDMEDPEATGEREQEHREPIKAPTAKIETITGVIEGGAIEDSKDPKNPWRLYKVKIDGKWFGTLDEKQGETAKALKGKAAIVTFTAAAKGNKIVSIEPAVVEPPKDPGALREEAVSLVEKSKPTKVTAAMAAAGITEYEDGGDWQSVSIEKLTALVGELKK